MHRAPSLSSKNSTPNWLASKGMYSIIASLTLQCLSSASLTIAGNRDWDKRSIPITCKEVRCQYMQPQGIKKKKKPASWKLRGKEKLIWDFWYQSCQMKIILCGGQWGPAASGIKKGKKEKSMVSSRVPIGMGKAILTMHHKRIVEKNRKQHNIWRIQRIVNYKLSAFSCSQLWWLDMAWIRQGQTMDMGWTWILHKQWGREYDMKWYVAYLEVSSYHRFSGGQL